MQVACAAAHSLLRPCDITGFPAATTAKLSEFMALPAGIIPETREINIPLKCQVMAAFGRAILHCNPPFVLQGTGRRRRKRLVELDRPGLGAAAGLSKMGIKHDIASVCPEACESGPPRPVSRCTSEVFEIAVESNQAVVRA